MVAPLPPPRIRCCGRGGSMVTAQVRTVPPPPPRGQGLGAPPLCTRVCPHEGHQHPLHTHVPSQWLQPSWHARVPSWVCKGRTELPPAAAGAGLGRGVCPPPRARAQGAVRRAHPRHAWGRISRAQACTHRGGVDSVRRGVPRVRPESCPTEPPPRSRRLLGRGARGGRPALGRAGGDRPAVAL